MKIDRNTIFKTIQDLYCFQRKPVSKIANYFNISIPTIYRLLQEFKIPRNRKVMQPQRGIDRDIQETIMTLYQKGTTIKAISEKVGYSEYKLRYHLKKWGIFKPERRKYSLKVKDIRKLHAKGLPISQIAKIMNIPYMNIYMACKRLNLTTKLNPYFNDERAPEIRELIRKGYSRGKLCQSYGVCYRTLKNFLIKHGIDKIK